MGELWERILQQTKEGKPLDNLYAPPPKRLFAIESLSGRMRGFVIKRVKDPLRRALTTGKSLTQVLRTVAIVAHRLPEINKTNTNSQRTYNLMAIEKKFFDFYGVQDKENPEGRTSMFRAVWNMYKFEVDHDEHYQGIHDWLIEQFMMLILTGEWVCRPPNNPMAKYWKEPLPYGGKNTITFAMQQHRREIIKLLGDKWQWLLESKYVEAQ